MRQVRRKSADPAARPYLLKAKNEGIELSWNRYERMLPQDGFGRLGLTCFECLQGPCRINPFSEKDERTVCGMSGDDLVYNGIYRLLTQNSESAKNMAQGTDKIEKLLNLAKNQIDTLKIPDKSQECRNIAKQIGFGVLKPEYVNICLEQAAPTVLDLIGDLAAEMENEATNRGAKGFNIVLAGDLYPDYPFNSVSNIGGVECAILTGILDFYAVGRDGLGLSKNAVCSYHTVYANADSSIDQEEIKNWLVQAAVAFSKRSEEKILLSDQISTAKPVDLDQANIKAHLEQGTLNGLCILGGGSNVKVTEDALICEVAEKLAEKNILCLAYGNAAVTLGKYGLLEDNKKSFSVSVAKVLGKEKGAPAYWVGGETEIGKIINLVQFTGSHKTAAVFPELTTARDLQAALALAGAGVSVHTSIKLPLDGSKRFAQEIGYLIKYSEPTELTDKVLAHFEL